MPTVKCSLCDSETTRTCPICSRPFCLDHEGSDADFCQECSSEETTKTEITQGFTTTDGNGVDTVHDVKVIRPVGEFFVSSVGAISRMSDSELERFYNRYTMLVHDCEAALERHRIVRSVIGMETDDRERARARALKSKSAKEIVKVVSASSSDLKLALLAAMLKKQGITKEKLQELINKKKGVTTNATT